MNEDTRSFFVKEKPVLALLSIKNSNGKTYCSKISDDIDSTYAHTVKIISKMRELGLIYTQEEGRKKIVTLSEKGERQAKVFQEVMLLYDKDSDAQGKLNDNRVFS